MTTFAQLTDRVLQNLQGDSLDQWEQTFLTSDVAVDALTFTVDDPNQISQGLCELGSELIWVKGVDRDTSTVTLSPFGRGYRSTTAATHVTGDAVVNNPRFSRSRVRETINTAIRGIYPDLYQVKSHEFTYVAVRFAYPLPADCDQIHSITWEDIGPSRVWNDITQYSFVPNADTTNFPDGKAVNIWDAIIPGRTIRVTYITAPSEMTLDADVFTTVTGLAATAEEAIVYGSCYRLIGFLEPARLQTSSVEASARSVLVQPGQPVNAGKFFYGLYLEALNQERERLLRSNRNSVHRTRRFM